MRIRLTNFKSKIILMFSIALFLVGCSDDDGQKSCFPKVTVDARVNLAVSEGLDLSTKGWTYVQGVGAGVSGLIVVNTGRGYKAYDRHPPHICYSNSLLEVQNDIKIYCPEDGAEWSLLDGTPIKIADRAPKTYWIHMNGNLLIIEN